MDLRERTQTEALRKLYNKELHNLYYLVNVIRAIKSRRVKLVEHVAHI